MTRRPRDECQEKTDSFPSPPGRGDVGAGRGVIMTMSASPFPTRWRMRRSGSNAQAESAFSISRRAQAGRRAMRPATGASRDRRRHIRAAADAAARELSGHIRPEIDFRLADAEQLPFADASFDGIISTFGVMFALDQPRAAAEMARVCRPRRAAGAGDMDAGRGGCGILRRYRRVQRCAASGGIAARLGRSGSHVEALLGDAFELIFEQGVNNAYHGSADDIWEWYVRGFGPLRLLAGQPRRGTPRRAAAGGRCLSPALCGAGGAARLARLSGDDRAAALSAAGRGAISAPRSRRQSDNRCRRRRSTARR